MASTIKVDNVQNQPGTNIINKCSVTTTIGAGAGETVNVCGATVNIGRSGGTVNLTCGATQTGFGRTGTVDWITTPKVTGDSPVTGVTGKGYFMNTTAGAITLNLPAGSAGDIISIQDYNNTFDTYALTVSPNGSEKINGGSAAGVLIIRTEGQGITFVYVDGTVGWKTVHENAFTSGGSSYIVASGGTESTSGDFKIHTFTGPGTLTVCAISPCAADNMSDYLVVAGGGAGGGPLGTDTAGGGGGGAGGFRMSNDTCMSAPQTSPLANSTGITLAATTYPIAVGGGGVADGNPPGAGGCGSTSTFSSIDSAGGGGGGSFPTAPVPFRAGQDGGSGGGAGRAPGGPNPGGSGNTPPVSPPQGNDGGDVTTCGSAPNYGQGGGGGAGGAGNVCTDQGPTVGGSGGVGSFVVSAGMGGCNGSPGPVPGARYFSGGGGGATYQGGTPGNGGVGGGGAGNNAPSNPASPGISGVAGGTNTGGGGGGMSQSGSGGAGGSGIVIIRYKFQ